MNGLVNENRLKCSIDFHLKKVVFISISRCGVDSNKRCSRSRCVHAGRRLVSGDLLLVHFQMRCADLLQRKVERRQSPQIDLHVVQMRGRTERRTISSRLEICGALDFYFVGI